MRGDAGGAGIAVRSRTARDLANGAILFGTLAAFIAAVYLAVVVGIGTALDTRTPNTGLSILATSIVALMFASVRRAARRVANRLTRGGRPTPLEVLARLSGEVGRTDEPGEALPRLARLLAQGTGAFRAEVWLRAGDDLLLAAWWPLAGRRRASRVALPDDARLPPIPGADRVAGVTHQGELLGALTIANRSGQPVTPAEDGLLSDVASQTGIVLRNVRLTAELAARLEEIEARAEELRASRQRIVEAQDAERRRLERDIHDGAQQHLVALAVKLRMARTMAERDPAAAAPMLADLRSLIAEALENLRDLTRGIYPPILAERGLAAALRAQGRASGTRVLVGAKGLRRLDPPIEAAAYFCTLEAIQNAAKHAAASVVRIHLEQTSGELRFTVSDDGGGFDVEKARAGAGLHNMADRLAVVGGTVEIRSEPRAGTTVTGRIPLRAAGVAS